MRTTCIFILCIFLFCFGNAQAQNFVTTYSGNGTPGFINGSIDSAAFNGPFGMCVDKFHNIYFAEANNNCIRKINTTFGTVITYAGTGAAGFKDGPIDSALFNSPSDLCVDDSGNIYVSDFLNQRIRKISNQGIVSTVAGSGTAGYLDGNHSTARFNYPRGICIDPSGNIFVSDSWNHRIRKIDPSGMVTTYAGGGIAIGVSSIGALTDGADTSARFYTPAGMSIDQYRNIYVADAYNHRIRKIDTARIVTTLIGSGPVGPGNGGFFDSTLSLSRLNTPTELFMDTSSNELYISDTFNNRIRKANFLSGTVITYAGNGSQSFINGIDSMATFNYPRGIVLIDSAVQMIYVADYNNNAIRLIGRNTSAGIEKGSLKNYLFVFPNPSASSIRISSKVEIRSITVLALTGNKVLIQTGVDNEIVDLDLSFLSKGFYLITIENINGDIITKKILYY
jgi:hypothetical protein